MADANPVGRPDQSPSCILPKNDEFCITSVFLLHRQNSVILDRLQSESDTAFSDLKVTVIMTP